MWTMGDPLANATAAPRRAGAPTLDCPASAQGGSLAFKSLSFSLSVKADLIRSQPHMYHEAVRFVRGQRIFH